MRQRIGTAGWGQWALSFVGVVLAVVLGCGGDPSVSGDVNGLQGDDSAAVGAGGQGGDAGSGAAGSSLGLGGSAGRAPGASTEEGLSGGDVALNDAGVGASAAPGGGASGPVVLTVLGSSGAFGMVTSTPAGLRCSAPPCRVEFPRGTALRIHALSAQSGGLGFAGWSGACSGLADCNLYLDGADVTLTATYARANVVFVTSTTTPGNFGGLAQADAICAARAQAAGITGTFRAWLSTDTVNALDRLAPARGWVRLDGKPVADSAADLANGRVFHPIRIDETGQDVGSRQVWTGTARDGRVQANFTCGNWTGTLANDPAGTATGGMGGANLGGRAFSNFYTTACGVASSLYCFGVDETVQLAPIPAPGRAAFTVSTFLVGGGLAAADASCQAEATLAGLPGTFKAVLATSTASAASRFDTSGLPWVRLDGIALAPTAAAFFGAAFWDTSLSLTATGSYLDSNGVMAGGTSLLTPGTAENTCADWTSTEGSRSRGTAAYSDVASALYASTASCSVAYYGVNCLEE